MQSIVGYGGALGRMRYMCRNIEVYLFGFVGECKYCQEILVRHVYCLLDQVKFKGSEDNPNYHSCTQHKLYMENKPKVDPEEQKRILQIREFMRQTQAPTTYELWRKEQRAKMRR